jgi:hypothetical protein
MRFPSLCAVLGLALLQGAGCGAGDGGCKQDTDCTPGRYCQQLTGECIFDCTYDVECPDFYLCTDRGRCERGCRDDAGCPAGQWCDAGGCAACEADDRCGPTCEDCTAGATDRVCVDGGCGCREVGDCATGEDCVAGRCGACVPQCAGRCDGGDDGCGGGCDGCPAGQRCSGDGLCEACDTVEYCGPACEACPAGAACVEVEDVFACQCPFLECAGVCCTADEICIEDVCRPPPVCGNDVVEYGEACDDGNTVDGDECNSVCTIDCTGGRTFERHCYRFGEYETWPEARQTCLDLGMYLVTVTSQAEMNFLRQLRDEVAYDAYFWIGLNDLETEGQFVWDNGEPLGYTSWGGGQPDDYGGAEDCVTVFRANIAWYDYPCDHHNVTVCEQ